MKQSLYSLTVFFFLFLLTFPGRAQGIIDGYMRGAGNTTVALSYSHESYSTYFVGSRPSTNTAFGTITTRSLNLYAATGLTDYLDVIVALPYISATPSMGILASQKGPQDVSLYLKARPYQVDMGKLGKVSTILAAGASTPVSDYIADFPVAIGHQSTQLDGRAVVHYQTSFGGFATVQGGYIRRSSVRIDRFDALVAVPDVWDWSAKVGFGSRQVYLDAWLNRQIARSGTDIGAGVPFPGNAVSYTRVGYTLYASIPKVPQIGVSFGMGFTLNGTNIGKATRYSVGLVYKLPSWKKS